MPEGWFARIAIVIITAVVGLIVLSLFLQGMKRSTLFFPERHPGGFWEFTRLPIQPTEHWITTPDGVRLHGLLFTPTTPANPPVTSIMFHGNAGNLTYRLDIALNLTDRGIAVFLFDYRGYGRSEGSPTEDDLVIDSIAVYDYVRDELGVDPGLIALHGESLGGAYAASVAAQRSARCVVIGSSFPSAMHVAQAVYPIGPLAFSLRNSLPTSRWLNQKKPPTLVFHGTHDEILPYGLGVQLHRSLEGRKRFYEVPGAGHNDIFSVGGERLYDEIAEFMLEVDREK